MWPGRRGGCIETLVHDGLSNEDDQGGVVSERLNDRNLIFEERRTWNAISGRVSLGNANAEAVGAPFWFPKDGGQLRPVFWRMLRFGNAIRGACRSRFTSSVYLVRYLFDLARPEAREEAPTVMITQFFANLFFFCHIESESANRDKTQEWQLTNAVLCHDRLQKPANRKFNMAHEGFTECQSSSCSLTNLRDDAVLSDFR